LCPEGVVDDEGPAESCGCGELPCIWAVSAALRLQASSPEIFRSILAAGAGEVEIGGGGTSGGGEDRNCASASNFAYSSDRSSSIEGNGPVFSCVAKRLISIWILDVCGTYVLALVLALGFDN